MVSAFFYFDPYLAWFAPLTKIVAMGSNQCPACYVDFSTSFSGQWLLWQLPFHCLCGSGRPFCSARGAECLRKGDQCLVLRQEDRMSGFPAQKPERCTSLTALPTFPVFPWCSIQSLWIFDEHRCRDAHGMCAVSNGAGARKSDGQSGVCWHDASALVHSERCSQGGGRVLVWRVLAAALPGFCINNMAERRQLAEEFWKLQRRQLRNSGSVTDHTGTCRWHRCGICICWHPESHWIGVASLCMLYVHLLWGANALKKTKRSGTQLLSLERFLNLNLADMSMWVVAVHPSLPRTTPAVVLLTKSDIPVPSRLPKAAHPHSRF